MDTGFLKDLNSRQREAATATEGRIRVIAGAGTGKTKALTYRYAYLVNVLGIDPADILCLTFTNKAAAEMRQRIAAMVHSGDYNDFVCTIDGFCVKFLRQEIYRLGFPKSFGILDEEDAKAVAKQCMDQLGIKRTEKTVKHFLDGIAVDKALDDYIDTYMLPGRTLSDGMKKGNLACFAAAQLKNWALDFDDIENFTRYILDHFADAREAWQQRLNYIMVDEAQDCNADNWDIIEKLAAGHGNLFVVGDPDQCIYEWRGARPSRFVEFASDKDIILDENYRSTPNILDVANSVIAHNTMRYPKDLFTRQAEGRAVIHFHGKTEQEEIGWVTDRIKELLAEGARPRDIAILYRSTYQSRAVEQALLKAQLKYTIWGGTRFFERKEIKDALGYLRLVNNPADDLAFNRVINEPSRKLGRAFLALLADIAGGGALYPALRDNLTVKGLDKPAAQEFVHLIEEAIAAKGEMRVSDLLDRLLDKSGLKRELREDQDEDRLENLDELIQSVRNYEKAYREDAFTLSDYLQDIALYTEPDLRKTDSAIKLMTIHQAKGLEFPYVFIIGLSEGIFPNMRTIREYKKHGEEEERRLMYVAMTRAERALFLTESEGFNVSTKMDKYPSRFLTEIRRNTFVTEGFIPDWLWKGTRNLMHVLDEETFTGGGATDRFAGERAVYQGDFQVGDAVVHEIFGEGVVVGTDREGTFQVRFSGGAVRHIRSSFLRLQDLPD